MMLSSVDLPQPDGPTMQRNSERSMSKLDVLDAGDLAGGRVVDQRDIADFDHAGSFVRQTVLTLGRAHHAPAHARSRARASRTPGARRRSRCAPITASEASIMSALRNSLASKITQPSPQSEAAIISAPTTAIQARRNACRMPVMMKGEAPGMITFQNSALLVGAHGAGRAQPQRIDRAHARPGVEQHRETSRHRTRSGSSVRLPMPNHSMNSGTSAKRRDRHQRADQRQDRNSRPRGSAPSGCRAATPTTTARPKPNSTR